MPSRKRTQYDVRDDDKEPGRQPCRRFTATQLDRKRQLDREAQRSSRAKTKSHIAHLEGLVRVLKGDHDERAERLIAQIDKQREEIRHLRTLLKGVAKLVKGFGDDEAVAQCHSGLDDAPARGKEDFPGPPPSKPTVALTFEVQQESETTGSMQHVESSPFSHQNLELGSDSPTITAANESSSLTTRPQHQSIAQLASSIVSKTALDGRLWYLAGGLLNFILKTHDPQANPIDATFDEDIAIRAIFEGWSSVMERYPLDRGWQWLKELDEAIYFNTPSAARLMHLRNTRLVFLRQIQHNRSSETSIPSFFAPSPSQINTLHDPLIEHFPWPGLREQMIQHPLRFATNKFMDAIREHGHFNWNMASEKMYFRDIGTGLYRYSDAIRERFTDLSSYSVEADFFLKFPELKQVLPCFTSSPTSLISRMTAIPRNQLEGEGDNT